MRTPSASILAALLVTAAAVAACDDKGKTDSAAPSTLSTGPVATPSASSDTASAAGLPNDSGPQSPSSPTPDTDASAGDASSAMAAPSGSAANVSYPACTPPHCPLQAWMKANTAPAMAAGDLPGLATALDKIQKLAPPGNGYPNWVSISKDGAAAARAGNTDAVKAACKACHDQYKSKYKTEMRGRPISA